MSPNGVEEEREQEEAYEEQKSLNQRDVCVHLLPVIPTHPPHVVGQNHPAVEHVNHYPLVCFPEQSPGPAHLSKKEKECENSLKTKCKTEFY